MFSRDAEVVSSSLRTVRIGIFLLQLVPAALFPGLFPLIFPIAVLVWDDVPLWYWIVTTLAVLVAAWIGYAGYMGAHGARETAGDPIEGLLAAHAAQPGYEDRFQKYKAMHQDAEAEGVRVAFLNDNGSTLTCTSCSKQWPGPSLKDDLTPRWWTCPNGCHE